MATDTTSRLHGYKPIQFGFDKKLAPRLGVVYDVFGDSSLKVFGSFGIYYDVMKLYMAEGAYGGFKWWTSYYTLDDYDFDQDRGHRRHHQQGRPGRRRDVLWAPGTGGPVSFETPRIPT